MSSSATSKPRRFEFSAANSNKFWEIIVANTEVTVRFGRIGTTGQAQTKSFVDAVKADAHAAKLVEQKLAKGYTEIK